jgi:uncharacterized C2H2 Zn-finger protein
MTEQDPIQIVVEAIERSGRPMTIRNGELCTRCPVCGDSTKSSYHKHFYLNLINPHPWCCQRCGARGGHLTIEILEGLGAAERDAAIYVRHIEKAERRSGRSRRKPPSLAAGSSRLIIPMPDRNDPDDAAAIGYIESRIGGPSLTEAEINRYRIVTCGLYGFLEVNGVDQLTIHEREADRLNETCVGFLSADESYVIFRTMDDDHVKRGGRRYTNYRIFPEWEGSKSFACRADVDLLSPRFSVVCSEGIIDLIQIERHYYPEARWKPDHVGVATCGASHEVMLRQLLTLGILSQDVDLYIDNKENGDADPAMIGRVRKIRDASPFFQTRDFRMSVYRNAFAGEKDFGVPTERHSRVQVRI